MIDRLGQPARARILAVLVLVGAFAAGIATGAAVTNFTGGSDEALAEIGPEPGRRPIRAIIRRDGGTPPVSALSDRLHLTPEQEEQVEGIFERRRQLIEATLGEVEPALRAHMDSARREIREILTPEQRVEFDRRVPRRGRVFRGPPPPPAQPAPDARGI